MHLLMHGEDKAGEMMANDVVAIADVFDFEDLGFAFFLEEMFHGNREFSGEAGRTPMF